MRFVVFLALTLAPGAWADSTISSNTSSNSAYGANIGWINWRGDGANGAVIGEYVCSGFIYSANVGWINLGNGAPTNGIQYQNISSNDFGVNHDGLGNLRGYAYGANIGWVNFETNGAPKIDLSNGRLSGSIYSANCGWISLSNAFAFVQTDSIRTGADTDEDGITDAWERLHFNGNLSTANALTDFDHDGQLDLAEHLADTDPLNPAHLLRITQNSVIFAGAQDTDTLVWESRPTRHYRIQFSTNLNSGFPWIDTGFLFHPSEGNQSTQAVNFTTPSSERYLRVQAVKPLQ